MWCGEYPAYQNVRHVGDDRESEYERISEVHSHDLATTADDGPLCGSVHCHGNVVGAERHCNPWTQELWDQGRGEITNECGIVSEDEGAQYDEGDISDSGVADMDALHDVYGQASGAYI